MNLRSAVLGGLGCSLAFATLLGSRSYAATFDYGAELGLGHSDNIRRVPDHEEDETIGSAAVDFSYQEKSSKLFADVAGDATFLDYFNNTFSSEVVGELAGTVDISFVPERFVWIFQDNFGQVRTDPFAPVTPDNRENVNYFTTGPDFTLHFGADSGFRLSGRFSNINYETTPADSNRYYGSATYFHELSSASSVSVNASRERIDFNAAGAPDYDRDELYGRYDIKGARTTLGVDLGYSRVNLPGSDDSSWLGRVSASRKVSPSSTVTLQLGHEFSDSGQAFRQEQGGAGGGLGAQTGLQTANPFTSEYVTLGWDFARQRTAFGVHATYRDESYVATRVLDDTRTLLDAFVSRDLSPELRVLLGATYGKNDFKHVNADYDETELRANLSWRLGRKLWLGLELQRFKRSSDIATGEYDENRAWLHLRYGDTPAARALLTDVQQQSP
jgi:hypothetical protein